MRLLIIALIAALISSPAVAQDSADWHAVAESIPLGSKVRVQRVTGDRLTGTLMRVDSATVVVARNARRPEPAVTIAFDQVAKIERVQEGGFSIGKAIAFGAATGAGAMLTLILFLMQVE